MAHLTTINLANSGPGWGEHAASSDGNIRVTPASEIDVDGLNRPHEDLAYRDGIIHTKQIEIINRSNQHLDRLDDISPRVNSIAQKAALDAAQAPSATNAVITQSLYDTMTRDAKTAHLASDDHGHMYLNESENLNDLPNKSTARNNLSVYSKAEIDNLKNRYLNESENLNDLDNKATARTNLSVYSKSELNDQATHYAKKEANLSDLVSASAARNNISVYSKAEIDDQATHYTTKAANLNDLADKAASRSNLKVYSKSEIDSQGTRYMTKAANLNDLSDKATARNNLSVYSKVETNDRLSAMELRDLSDVIITTTPAPV